jgi:hypothetical protein
VVLWLNGNTIDPAADDENGEGNGNGIEVMSSEYTSCLLNIGIGINTRSHPDFASKMGSLKIGSHSRCEEQVHELLGQRQNRLVIFGPGISFLFLSEGQSQGQERNQEMKFAERMVVGLVYVFSRAQANS